MIKTIDWVYTQYSEEFIEKHIDKVHWINIYSYQVLSELFIEKHIDKVNWASISRYQKLSEEFIEKHIDKIDLLYISEYQFLSEAFIEKHIDKLDWNLISKFQKFSELFIEKHIDKLDWHFISSYQQLSELFIEKYIDKINMELINTSQILSRKFIKKHNLERTFHHKTILQKKKLLGDLYEFDDDYIIAYKSVRNNRKYQYKVGETFTSTCDCNVENEYSYGFSAWIKANALKYHSKGKILKVRIHLNDLGAFIPSKNKQLRCFKLEVLEEV